MDNKKIKKQEDEIIEETVDAVEDENTREKELEDQLSDLDNKYKRALADYQNLEKRVREEKSEWIKSASQNVLLRLLPVLDTLQKAQQHSSDQTVAVVANMFLDSLKSEGIEKIETVGKTFDPLLMEAVEIIAGDDNIVIEERRPGYLLYGRLLRPAEVAVGDGK